MRLPSLIHSILLSTFKSLGKRDLGTALCLTLVAVFLSATVFAVHRIHAPAIVAFRPIISSNIFYTSGTHTIAAASYTWTGTVNTDWTNPGNWSPAPRVTPAATDILFF